MNTKTDAKALATLTAIIDQLDSEQLRSLNSLIIDRLKDNHRRKIAAIQGGLGAAIKGRWIPVSERLPSVAQEVIVNSEFDGVTAGFLDSYGEWYSPNSDYKLTRVVAWQPLPAAPALLA